MSTQFFQLLVCTVYKTYVYYSGSSALMPVFLTVCLFWSFCILFCVQVHEEQLKKPKTNSLYLHTYLTNLYQDINAWCVTDRKKGLMYHQRTERWDVLHVLFIIVIMSVIGEQSSSWMNGSTDKTTRWGNRGQTALHVSRVILMRRHSWLPINATTEEVKQRACTPILSKNDHKCKTRGKS